MSRRPASASPACVCPLTTWSVYWLRPSLRAVTVVAPMRSDSILAVSMSLTPNATMRRGVGDQRAGLGIGAFELAQVLEDQHGAGIGAQIAHALLQRFEISERRRLIEQEQRPLSRRRRCPPGPEYAVQRQARHHPQERAVDRQLLLGHDQIDGGGLAVQILEREIARP